MLRWPDRDDAAHTAAPSSEVRARERHPICRVATSPRTPSHAQVCLTADDLEAINTLYPVCTGHDMTVTTAQRWNCGKAKQRIGRAARLKARPWHGKKGASQPRG